MIGRILRAAQAELSRTNGVTCDWYDWQIVSHTRKGFTVEVKLGERGNGYTVWMNVHLETGEITPHD